MKKKMKSLSIILSVMAIAIITKTVNANLKNICEPTDSLFCNCDDHDRTTSITCYTLTQGPKLTSNDTIWWSFASQPNIKTLKMSGWKDMRLTEFPAPVFRVLRLTLTQVVLSDLNIRSLPRSAFFDMPILESVEITLCPRMIIEDHAFDRLPSLEKLVMTKNNMLMVPEMFNETPNLRELYLEDNKIETFSDRAFYSLSKLSYLTLDRNRIKQIEPEKYAGLENLLSLELTSNLIKHIPARAFERMPLLNEIDLSNNQIETIDPEAFLGLNKLQEIRLDHNLLEMIGDEFRVLPALILVNLEYNRLHTISKGSFHRPLQKRYVHIKIKGNDELNCNCHLYWLSEIQPTFENRFQDLQTVWCHKENPSDRNQSVYEFLTSEISAKQCRLPEASLEPDDIYETAVPIQTIDSITDMDDIENEPIMIIPPASENPPPMPAYPEVPSTAKTIIENYHIKEHENEHEREEDDVETVNIDLNRAGGFGSGDPKPGDGNGSATTIVHPSLLLLLLLLSTIHISLFKAFDFLSIPLPPPKSSFLQ